MISWHLAQASSFAADIDRLILWIALLVVPFFLAAELVLLGLIVRFRARPGVKARHLTGDTAHERRWVSYPHYLVLVFDVIIVVAALRVWNDVKVYMPATQEDVRIIAQQWAWTFVHAGPDGRLDTPDDIRTVNDLNLTLGRLYRYELHSKDVLHSFSVPAFRLKQDAVPGRAIAGWFRPTLAGAFDIQCAELCGIGHALMPARVHVLSASAHAAWMRTAADDRAGGRAAGTALAHELSTGALPADAPDHRAHQGRQGQ